MARKPRVEFAGAFYHVIVRGNQRRKIFYDEQDRLSYLQRLESYRERYGFTLCAYVLMPNTSIYYWKPARTLFPQSCKVYSPAIPKCITGATEPWGTCSRGAIRRFFVTKTSTCLSWCATST